VGVRYDSLDPGAADPFNPRKWSAMADWSPSEFSRVRLQYARSETVAGITDNQFFVQYILSLGAHGAHKY
jgi:outer membrane receptor protein involved in Fe transport